MIEQSNCLNSVVFSPKTVSLSSYKSVGVNDIIWIATNCPTRLFFNFLTYHLFVNSCLLQSVSPWKPKKFSPVPAVNYESSCIKKLYWKYRLFRDVFFLEFVVISASQNKSKSAKIYQMIFHTISIKRLISLYYFKLN